MRTMSYWIQHADFTSSADAMIDSDRAVELLRRQSGSDLVHLRTLSHLTKGVTAANIPMIVVAPRSQSCKRPDKSFIGESTRSLEQTKPGLANIQIETTPRRSRAASRRGSFGTLDRRAAVSVRLAAVSGWV